MAITGLVVPVSGPYTATWFAFALGVQNDDGYELAVTLQGQEVNETDQYGMTLVEAVYRGMNWRARMRNLEWPKGGIALLTMFGSQSTIGDGKLNPILGSIGNRYTLAVQPLILTSILGNPPSTPTTLTANGAGFAPNSQSMFNMTSKVRELPLELVLLPYASAGSGSAAVPFTVT
jgi:hypothetical protein